ncbi:hypothetical protein ACLKA7_016388 [Drosophila subpalustris]
MENIVYNFAKISFQPKEVVLTENRSAPIFASANNFGCNLKPMADMLDDALESESGDTDQSDEIDSQQSRSEDNDESDSSSRSYGHRGGVSRRRMPARVSKDNFNRVCSAIMKPNKKKRRELHTNEQTLKSIEKIYTNKRMKKFTPANLETIFEEPSDENAADVEDDSEECAITSQVRLVKFGSRKMRRAISFNDGLNKNKNLIKKRRLKVKKAFGKRCVLKKISMTEFHDRLNKSLDSAMFEDEEDAPSGSAESTLKTEKAAVTTFMDDMQLPPLSSQSTAFE